MTERKLKFNRLVPELKVTNIERSLHFYRDILGFKIEYARPEFKFAYISLQGSQIMIEQDDALTIQPPFGQGMHLQMEVDSIAPLESALAHEGISLFEKTHEKWYRKDNILLGNKQFYVQDPDGYLLRFFEDLGTKQA